MLHSKAHNHCSGGDFFCNRAWTGGIRLVVVFSSLLLLLVDPVAEVLRKVFRSGLANWSAAPNVSSPSLLPLPAELLVDEDIESAETLARGRGLGFDNGAVEAGRSRTKSGVCFCFCWIEVRWLQKSRLERNPPRRLPMLSVAEAVEATVDPAAPGPVVLFSHIDLFLLNPPALVSPCPENENKDMKKLLKNWAAVFWREKSCVFAREPENTLRVNRKSIHALNIFPAKSHQLKFWNY